MEQKTTRLDQLRIDRTEAPRQYEIGKRSWFFGLSAVVLIVAGAAGWAFSSVRVGIAVHTVVAKAIPMSGGGAAGGGSLLDASGYVVAQREASVSAKAINKVTQVLVEEADTVKHGEVLARLDDTNARAALEQAKAQVKHSRRYSPRPNSPPMMLVPTYRRNQTQLSEGLISQETFDASKSAFDAAQAAEPVAEGNLTVAKAAVAVNQRYEDDTVIQAPFDGVVTVKTAQPGGNRLPAVPRGRRHVPNR